MKITRMGKIAISIFVAGYLSLFSSIFYFYLIDRINRGQFWVYSVIMLIVLYIMARLMRDTYGTPKQ